MNWNNFKTYGESSEKAFETLCNQLFERYLHRKYNPQFKKYRVINGAGGDGGIEAYGELDNGNIIAIQSKYFRQTLDDSQIKQIKNSIITAKDLRKSITVYIICIPHNVSSLKIGRGKTPTINHEENKINLLVDEIKSRYNDLELIWWFDNEIFSELQISDNEGVHKYWFDKEVISIKYLQNQFELQKKGWLKVRYISELHGNGLIHKEYNKLCFSIGYRAELSAELNKDIDKLNCCINLINEFIRISSLTYLNKRLLVIQRNISHFLSTLEKINIAIKNGYDYISFPNISEVDIWKTKTRLERINPTNLQKNILPKLISILDEIHGYNLPQYVKSYCDFFNQRIRLILGGAGTGKTHGLSKCVENHLEINAPALIIPAKGNYFNNWTDILSKAVEQPTWTKQDIFSALESCAIRRDNEIASTLLSGEELNCESTKILICVDGLEEDILNQDGWHERIRESAILIKDYPRLRFLFSARNYFSSNDHLPKSADFDVVNLPREGDVSLHEVIDGYLKEYDIKLSYYGLIKGIDSLLALRLFCEKYQGKEFYDDGNNILTATTDLLNDKVQRANDEFAQLLLPKRLNKTRHPVLESLLLIAKHFYLNLSIEHNDFCDLLTSKINYLDISEIDILIEYFSNNGFLIKSDVTKDEGRALKEITSKYNVTYQSIIEHIISIEILNDIKNNRLTKIPDLLHEGMIMPLDYTPKRFSVLDSLPNKKIIQDIVNNIFNDTGRLIGENNFLTEGFNDDEVFEIQMEAIRQAPYDLALKYKAKIDSLFYGGYKCQYKVLKSLIIPSSYSNLKFFGAEYLHEILINQPSAFERDKLWSGLDEYEKYQFDEQERFFCNFYSLNTVFDELGIGSIHLYSEQEHNERPLVFAWGLSTINQELRRNLRIALTEWAIENPSEFKKLLDKIFFCNDPQIQEDLASIMLGVATKLKDKKSIKELAIWAIDNIFSKIDIYRNIIIRHGFRAIVEKAYLFGEITKEKVNFCKPKQIESYHLLNLDQDYLKSPAEEYYPIVHDLAWYVIKKSYSSFLEYPSILAGELKDNNCIEASLLLSQYNIPKLYARDFGMASAISYIKSLGFSRTEGNGHTDETHGGKSEIFTYEEKYTWLAVHYIQGYLADYIPLKQSSNKRKFITDYSQLSEIHNPGEEIKNIDESFEDFETGFSKDWVINESLATEITENITGGIYNNVNTEVQYDFGKWIEFNSNNFNIKNCDNNWIALYNLTELHDSQSLIYCSILIEACLIKKENKSNFIQIMTNSPENFDFISEFNSLISYPKEDSNCNPSDLIWMNWVDEDNQTQKYHDSIANTENELLNTIVDVNYFKMPSKIIRQYLEINELKNNKLLDENNELMSFIHKKNDSDTNDKQHMVLINEQRLKAALEKDNYEIVWFAEILKQKNPLNDDIKDIEFVQKVRKYLIWASDSEFKNTKIWDYRFSNSRK